MSQDRKHQDRDKLAVVLVTDKEESVVRFEEAG